jgi:ABC-type multidrug transport system fused ATPase/permease subunit
MRPDYKVLNNVTLNISAGTTCALVGRSGGGKTTLVSLLMRFYDPKEGQILLDGVPLTDLKLRDVRRNIGIVQQNTELFGGTIEDNITYGMEPGSWTREDVIQAAKSACAHDFIKSFPEGYLTRVGERGVRISGGQKQRISIARVFLRKPKILLLDEATSALDAESEAAVQEALDKLMKTSSYGSGHHRNAIDANSGCTVILVAHRLSTVINADQIAVVQDGRLVEVGNHESLISKPDGAYARLVAKQMKKANSIIDADSLPLQAAKSGPEKPDEEEEEEEDDE